MRNASLTANDLLKHNQQSSGQSMEVTSGDDHADTRANVGSSDVYNYGVSGGHLPPMAAPLSARSITDCDSLFEEMLKGGGMFSPMAGSISGGTPYGFASTSGLNGSILANAAKERKGTFEDLMSPNGRRGDCPPPVGGLSRGNSSRGGRVASTGGSSSPTSRAMSIMQPMMLEYERMLVQERIAKRQKETKSQVNGESDGLDEVIPLQMLPYFRWLNDAAQRSLLKQLIERFQRTSYTPRYASIATPVHGMTSGLGDKNTNQDADLDPNCFDKIEGEGPKESEQSDKVTSSGQKLKNNTENNARLSGGGSETDDLPPSPAVRPLLRTSSSSTSMFDDAAIEAAVAVAMQLASHSSSAEQILQILTGNTNPDDSSNKIDQSTSSGAN